MHVRPPPVSLFKRWQDFVVVPCMVNEEVPLQLGQLCMCGKRWGESFAGPVQFPQLALTQAVLAAPALVFPVVAMMLRHPAGVWVSAQSHPIQCRRRAVRLRERCYVYKCA